MVIETKNEKVPNTSTSGGSSKTALTAKSENAPPGPKKLSFECYYKSTLTNEVVTKKGTETTINA